MARPVAIQVVLISEPEVKCDVETCEAAAEFVLQEPLFGDLLVCGGLPERGIRESFALVADS